jgi:hypothetical protein
VDVLTNPKSSGYIQNPISVYYCYSKAGQLVKGIAEVSSCCIGPACGAQHAAPAQLLWPPPGPLLGIAPLPGTTVLTSHHQRRPGCPR